MDHPQEERGKSFLCTPQSLTTETRQGVTIWFDPIDYTVPLKVTYFSLSTSRKICSVHFETDLVPVKGVRKGNCPNCLRVCCIIVTDLSGRALGRQEKEDTRTSLSAPHGGQRPCCFRCDNTLNTKVRRCCETCSSLRTLSPFLKHLNQTPESNTFTYWGVRLRSRGRARPGVGEDDS